MTAWFSSEWLKLRSTRSTHWILLTVVGLVVLCALWSWYVAHYWDGLSAERQAKFQAASAEHPLVLALPLCLGLLGILAITSEYATGLIRSSLAAVPRRNGLFAAKAGTVGAVAFTTALVSVFLAYLLGRLIVGDRPITDLRAPLSEALPWLLSLSLYATVIALVGLGLGTTLRSTAGAVTTLCALLFIVPVLGRLIPSPWNTRFVAVLPSDLPWQIAGDLDDPVIPPPVAIAILIAYAVTALAAGLLSLKRRDV